MAPADATSCIFTIGLDPRNLLPLMNCIISNDLNNHVLEKTCRTRQLYYNNGTNNGLYQENPFWTYGVFSLL